MWELRPCLGLGRLSFRMSSSDVAGILGKPSWREERDGVIEEQWSLDQPRCFYRGGRLSEVSVMPATGCVTLNGFDLFAADEADALRFVQAASQDSLFEDLGFIISPALGMKGSKVRWI